ncbi:hypothetical protein F2Q68_00015073 [Brassica cretica]|uniref:Uncharacterized protein n=1 Tax=Brassica cretica TaxID=69181 RepID=A0A8S9HM06_BRACR|nr:hypothetical protein F2Q68_00015073 [Brassica cretica]
MEQKKNPRLGAEKTGKHSKSALEQYKAVVQEEAKNKGAPPSTFEDEPSIQPVSEMDVDSSIKPRGSPTLTHISITQGSGDSLGILRLRLRPERWAMNPGVSSFLEYGLLESCNLEVVGEPGGSLLDLEIVSGTRRSCEDTVFGLRSIDHIGTLRSRENPEVLMDYRNPEVSSLDPETFDWNPEVLEVLMTPMRPRLYRGSRFFFEIFFGTLRPYRNPEVLPWILRSLIGTRRLCGNPEEVTDKLRGCWCGRYDPSARLRCFPRLEKQGFHCSMYFKGPRCALGCTGVLGGFDSILRLAHTHSCFMSHTYFNLVDVPLFARVGQDRRSLET